MSSLSPLFASLLEEVAFIGELSWKKGWAEGAAGNLSIALKDPPLDPSSFSSSSIYPLPQRYPRLARQYFLVSGSGQRLRDFSRHLEECLGVLYIEEGGDSYRVCWGFQGTRPSSELNSHLAIHEVRQSSTAPIQVVYHVHATHLILVSSYENCRTSVQLSSLLCTQHTEVDIYLKKGVAYIGVAVPGSTDLMHQSLEAFRSYDIAVWEGHGAVSVGPHIRWAYDVMEVADKQAELFLKGEHSGLPRRRLSPYFRQEIYKKLFEKR
jgi:rhamnulose-1-phosphate aldolase